MAGSGGVLPPCRYCLGMTKPVIAGDAVGGMAAGG